MGVLYTLHKRQKLAVPNPAFWLIHLPKFNSFMFYITPQAVKLDPENGNPYNQLAVLATYAEDELGAVHYYCRGLAVGEPFPKSKENLVALLKKSVARVQGRGGLAAVLGPVDKVGWV